MTKNTLIFIVLLPSLVCFGQTGKRLKGVDKELTQILEKTNAAGFSVAVVYKNSITYAKGFGYRDIENRVPADAHTLYAIGSTTKAFTSAILGQLRDGDSLSLDDNPRKYLPELEFYNDELNSHVIIKDLMRHSTGIPRHDLSWYLFPSDSADSLLHRIKFQEPFTGLRQQWYYNNFMFLVQGEIAHKLTHKPWTRNMEERFFAPLDMTRSNLSIDALQKEDNRALGYVSLQDGSNKKTEYFHIAGIRAAGSINSSVMEMSHWLMAWINNGKYNGQQVIPERYRKEAITPCAVVDAAMSARLMALEDAPELHIVNYGYGWFITDYHGHYQVEHAGHIDGFSASVAFYPKDSLGIVVLTNQDNSMVPPLVRNTIADRMLSLKKKDWLQRYLNIKEKTEQAQTTVKADAAPTTNTAPSHNAEAYTGKYTHNGYGEFDIVDKNDSLFALFKNVQLWLKHDQYDIFTAHKINAGKVDTLSNLLAPLKFNFTSNLSGAISGANIFLEPTLPHPIVFEHTPRTFQLDATRLEAFTGEYALPGMTIKVHTEKGVLYASVPGQTDYALIPTGKLKFNFKVLNGYIAEFTENTEGEIVALNLIQPNGTFKAVKK